LRVVSEEVEGISYLYPAGLLAGAHTGGPAPWAASLKDFYLTRYLKAVKQFQHIAICSRV
jgi:hypothetical protein